MRDVYEKYGYDFHFYDGRDVDEAQVDQWISGFTTAEHYICDAWRGNVFAKANVEFHGVELTDRQIERILDETAEKYRLALRENWHSGARILLRGLKFVNKNGQPLRMIPKLELDPDLLEHPLYH